MKVLLIVTAIVVLGFLLHRALLAADARGWVFYKTRPPRIHFTGMLEELVEPRVEYMIEEQSSEAIRADVAESGDPEDPDG